MRAPLNSVTLFFRGPCTVRLAGIGLCLSSRATRVISMRRTSSPEDEYFSIRIGTKRSGSIQLRTFAEMVREEPSGFDSRIWELTLLIASAPTIAGFFQATK